MKITEEAEKLKLMEPCQNGNHGKHSIKHSDIPKIFKLNFPYFILAETLLVMQS